MYVYGVLPTWVPFVLSVYVCVCVRALIYSNTYTCVPCINEPQGTTVRDERNEVVLHRYWTSVQHVDCSHQKTRMPLFLPRITPIPIYFHPVYFHSPRSHTRLCLYPIFASSPPRVTFSRSETKVRTPVSLPSFLLCLPFFSSSFHSHEPSVSYD